MLKVIALWTTPDNPDSFEKEYAEVHNPLVPRVPGLRSFETAKAVDGPYYRIAQLGFDSLESFQAAGGTEEGKALFADAARLQAAHGNELTVLLVEVD